MQGMWGHNTGNSLVIIEAPKVLLGVLGFGLDCQEALDQSPTPLKVQRGLGVSFSGGPALSPWVNPGVASQEGSGAP